MYITYTHIYNIINAMKRNRERDREWKGRIFFIRLFFISNRAKIT